MYFDFIDLLALFGVYAGFIFVFVFCMKTKSSICFFSSWVLNCSAEEVFLEVLESQGVKDIENVQDVEDDVDDNGADSTSAGSAGNYEASVSPVSEEKEGIIVATVL